MAEKNDKQSIGVYLPASLIAEIDEAAAARGMSRNAFLAFVLDRTLTGRASRAYEELVSEHRSAG